MHSNIHALASLTQLKGQSPCDGKLNKTTKRSALVTDVTHIIDMEPLRVVTVCNTKKAVPLHATEALGWRRYIAPTHSRPRH
jgi:hypothetical protein